VYAYAFSLEVDRVVAARVGLGGVVLDRRELARPRGDRPAVKVVAPFAEFVRESEKGLAKRGLCVGGAAAVTAMARLEDGEVRLCEPGALDEPFAAAIAEALADTRGTVPPLAVRSTAD